MNPIRRELLNGIVRAGGGQPAQRGLLGVSAQLQCSALGVDLDGHRDRVVRLFRV
jgi:hypothetical protein